MQCASHEIKKKKIFKRMTVPGVSFIVEPGGADRCVIFTKGWNKADIVLIFFEESKF